MKFGVEPSPDYIEHVSKVDSDINKQIPSNILKLDDGDRNKEDSMLDSADVKGLQSLDVSQSHSEFKSCNLPDNIKNNKNESGPRNSPCLSATSEIDLIAQEDLFYMDKAVTDGKDIYIDKGMQAIKVKESNMLIDETPEREKNSEDLEPSLTTENFHSLGEILQRNNGDRETAGPSNEYHAEHGYYGSLIDERRQLDATERIACTQPSEEIIELRSCNFEELKVDFPRLDSSNHNGSTAENQDLRQKIDQVAEDSTNMISKRLFGEDVSASTSDLDAEGTSIVGNKNKVLNNQLSFQSQNDDVGTEEVMGSGDGTTPARISFTRPVYSDSDLNGPSYLHGSIATSTHIPYSGSISFKSESSTTSTRSFAFPKLQAEWNNSSPVRMAKAESRRLRRLRGWKSKLLCCKF